MQPFVLYKSVVQLVHGDKGSPSSGLSFSFNSSPVIAFYITEKKHVGKVSSQCTEHFKVSK